MLTTLINYWNNTRLDRKSFLIVALVFAFLNEYIRLAAYLISRHTPDPTLFYFGIFFLVWCLMVCAVVFRLRDAGKSVWLSLIPLTLLAFVCYGPIPNVNFPLDISLETLVFIITTSTTLLFATVIALSLIPPSAVTDQQHSFGKIIFNKLGGIFRKYPFVLAVLITLCTPWIELYCWERCEGYVQFYGINTIFGGLRGDIVWMKLLSIFEHPNLTLILGKLTISYVSLRVIYKSAPSTAEAIRRTAYLVLFFISIAVSGTYIFHVSKSPYDSGVMPRLAPPSWYGRF